MDEDYIILRYQPQTRLDHDTQEVVDGVLLTVKDKVSGWTERVFVPRRIFDAGNSRNLIEQALQPVRELHGIGREQQ